ncbi:unnamed protein product [Adineta steineri]|uniref:Alpha/beta hydrolase fold-3 domain-containing protein n=1 Tax=Adineta steineri TaxID=433720 RepID=A0A814P1G5_9BILA|nr:unnamed protein product [Adineta steineri]CAF3611861.1 unnamed protein product [Adineta steineri]
MSIITTDADYEYSPSRWSRRFETGDKVIEAFVQATTKATESARTALPCLLNWSVDTATTSFHNHAIDIYFPLTTKRFFPKIDMIKPKAIFVFIHGGYWQARSRHDSGFMAKTMSDAQILTAVIDYPIAPQVTIDEIVACIEESFVKVLQWAMELSTKVYICGHSAGAHLASTLLLIDWETKYNIEPEIFGGFFLISGIYNLTPLVPTYINEPLGMTVAIAKNHSPLYRDSKDYWSALKSVPIFCICAEYDPTSFHDQNEQYGSYLKQIGYDNITIKKLDDCDHFDIMEQLIERDQPLTNIILSFIENSA